MADESKIEELPSFFQKKIKELDNFRDEDLLYGKKCTKRIYMDAYAVAKYCVTLDKLENEFIKESSKKQYEHVPELDPNHSNISFAMVISYATQYLETKDLPPFFQRKIEEINGKSDDDFFFGKDLTKKLVKDAYEFVKNCGDMAELERFFGQKEEEQCKEASQILKSSDHSGASLSMVIGYAKQYFESEIVARKKAAERINGGR